MSFEKTLQVLGRMQQDGVFEKYAIGGAVAAFLYIEPGTTFDLDVFIAWETAASGLVDFGPIYQYLGAKGYQPQREGILIEGWEVQFLPPGSALEKEALDQSVPIEISRIPTHIFSREHLMAICLKTGRPKDYARLVQFVEESGFDEARLRAIAKRHGLEHAWEEFKKRFLPP